MLGNLFKKLLSCQSVHENYCDYNVTAKMFINFMFFNKLYLVILNSHMRILRWYSKIIVSVNVSFDLIYSFRDNANLYFQFISRCLHTKKCHYK